VESRAHKLALALLASVNILLHRIDDLVVVGEVSVVSHAATVETGKWRRQQTNVAKVGRGCGLGSVGRRGRVAMDIMSTNLPSPIRCEDKLLSLQPQMGR